MFDALFETYPCDLGGGVVAHLLHEPSLASLKAMRRAMKVIEAEPDEEALGSEKEGACSMAFYIQRWEGCEVPWPPLEEEGALEQRMDVVQHLPPSAVVKLTQAIMESVHVTSDEKKPSETPSESAEGER